MAVWTFDTNHFSMDAGTGTHTMDGWHNDVDVPKGGGGGVGFGSWRDRWRRYEDEEILKVIKEFLRFH